MESSAQERPLAIAVTVPDQWVTCLHMKPLQKLDKERAADRSASGRVVFALCTVWCGVVDSFRILQPKCVLFLLIKSPNFPLSQMNTPLRVALFANTRTHFGEWGG